MPRFYVVNEYGTLKGLITLEDLFEMLTGMEIVDEGDDARNMQALARRFARMKARERGIEMDDPG